VLRFFLNTLIALLLILTTSLFSQDFKKKFEDAEYYFLFEEYDLALPIYLELFKQDTTNANLSYRIGICYSKSNSLEEKKKAIPYLEYASKHISNKYKEGSYRERNAPPDVLFSLGIAYRENMNFDKAIDAFKKFTQVVPVNNVDYIDYAKREIQCTENAKQLTKTPIKIEPQNLSEIINAPDEIQNCPVVSDDESVIVFTAGKKNIFNADPSIDFLYNDYKLDDIYFTKKVDNKWTEPINISKQLGIGSERKTVPVSISADGKELYLVKDDNDNGNIYVSYYIDGKWTKMKPLNKNINTKYWESHATITKDGNTLFFTSDRPGGFGGLDIYRSDKNEKGEWGPAVNLGPTINSIYDEETPFVVGENGNYILFFSSQGHYSMGGFDVFYSVLLKNGKWTTPVNLGYPLNTVGNDLFYVPKANGQYFFFPLNNNERSGITKNNIYKVKVEITVPVEEVEEAEKVAEVEKTEKVTELEETEKVAELNQPNIIEEKKPLLVTIKGYINLADNSLELPQNISITISDTIKNKPPENIIPEKDTKSFTYKVPPGNYTISVNAPGYNEHKEYIYIPNNYSLNEFVVNILLQPIEVSKKEYFVIRNIFFDYGKYDLRRESEIELQRLAQLMERNPSLMVEVIGHTDALGSDQFNQKLSEKRAKAAVDYLVSLGIDPSRFVTKGMGKRQFIAINQNPDGTDNPEGRQLNRRVEIKLLNSVPDSVIVEEINVPPHLRYRKDIFGKADYTYTVLIIQQKEKQLDINVLNKLLNLTKILKNDSLFNNVNSPIENNKIGDMLVFNAGLFKNKSDAIRILNLIIDNGFEDATIISTNELGKIKTEIFRNYEKQKEIEEADVKKNYTIQIKAFTSPVDLSIFKNLNGVEEHYCNDGFYRYTYGKFKTRNEALKEKEKIVELGYFDAFVIELDKFKQKVIDKSEFTIQLKSSASPLKLTVFKDIKNDVREVIGNDGQFKYIYGTYKTISEAKKDLEKLKKNGYTDAFITNTAVYK